MAPNRRLWINPTTVALPTQLLGATWSGSIPQGSRIVGVQWAWSMSNPPSVATPFPLGLRARLSEGFGGVFFDGPVQFQVNASHGTKYWIVTGGRALPRPFGMSSEDKTVTASLYGSSLLVLGGIAPGVVATLQSGQVLDGTTVALGTALLVELPEVR